MKETIANMESLGIYREEFTATIKAYAQLRYLHDLLNERFAEGGYLVTEYYKLRVFRIEVIGRIL